jgi:hypothetical protein
MRGTEGEDGRGLECPGHAERVNFLLSRLGHVIASLEYEITVTLELEGPCIH